MRLLIAALVLIMACSSVSSFGETITVYPGQTRTIQTEGISVRVSYGATQDGGESSTKKKQVKEKTFLSQQPANFLSKSKVKRPEPIKKP